MRQTLGRINNGMTVKDDDPLNLASDVVALGGPDPPNGLAALKEFTIPLGDAEEEGKAVGRLETEIKALTQLTKLGHPGILKLIHANPSKRFIVAEYHPGGTLDKQLSRYKGAALKALEAFRPLVDAVAEIHGQNAIHRDIKTENIFVAADGRLVLGDFGIVIFKDGPGERLTKKYEKVGTSFWMAPWAYKNQRLEIEEVTPSLDIFPSAKVLWSMISGRDGFPFWEIGSDENNLEKIFPSDPMMPRVQRVLSKCIVRQESDCTLSARGLLEEVDKLIEMARSAGQRPDDDGPWLCRMCGRGHYVEPKAAINQIKTDVVVSATARGYSDRVQFKVYTCDRCGHVEMFSEQIGPILIKR